MSSASFVGTYLAEADPEGSSHPIGAGTQVVIAKDGDDYTITAAGATTAIWHQFTGRLNGEKIEGTIATQPRDIPFTIEKLGTSGKIQCFYDVVITETGSWTADDEGLDP